MMCKLFENTGIKTKLGEVKNSSQRAGINCFGAGDTALEVNLQVYRSYARTNYNIIRNGGSIQW
jgi:hypothetical protein